MIFNNPTMNPTMTTAVNTTANANVREITLTTKILNPKTKEDGTITGLLLFSKATDYSQIAALQNAIAVGSTRSCTQTVLLGAAMSGHLATRSGISRKSPLNWERFSVAHSLTCP